MKVIVKGRENRDQLEIFSIEGFVPADHLLRKIDSAVDFNHIYDISQVTNWVRLKFATMNLKKYALHRWKRSHQYSALINLYTFFCQNKTHNPKSRLEFRVIRQTETAIIRRCISVLAAHLPKNSEPSAGQGRMGKAFPAWRSWCRPKRQIFCSLPTAVRVKPTKRD